MNYRLSISCFFLFLALPLFAQQPDSTKPVSADTTKVTQPPPAPAPTTPPATIQSAPQETNAPSKVYYGGTFGMTFGDYTSYTISPMVGYNITPILSGGARITYEYIKDKRYTPELTASNYGGSVFGRARVHPNLYLQAEFEYMSYEYQTANNASTRDWVPFLYLGGGLVKEISPNVALVAEVLVDVLQDPKSPYSNWTPMISVGVVAGF